jgi:hypothetical protein
MGILAKAMGEHLAQCPAVGYNAPESAQCPFVPPTANDAWTIGRFLHAHGMPLPRTVDAIGSGRYTVDGVAHQVASHDLVQLLQ